MKEPEILSNVLRTISMQLQLILVCLGGIVLVIVKWRALLGAPTWASVCRTARGS